MTPTHSISADEARRLLEKDREASALRAARAWYQSVEHTLSPYWTELATPFGTFTWRQLRGDKS